MPQEQAMLSALLNRSSSGSSLHSYLPESIAHEVDEWTSAQAPDFSKLLSQKGWFQSIHFSWFSEPIASFPPEARALFLSLLEQKKAAQIAHMLDIPTTAAPFSRFMRPFLLDELRQKLLRGIEVARVEHLPPSPLNVLVSLKRVQLLQLIDLLGVYDVATDMRQIVDKTLLRKVYAALSETQLKFLHYCSKQPMKWISPKLHLSAWDGTKETLRRLVHSRGLARLAHALRDESESLKWHLLHRLDTGRAAIVEKVMHQVHDPALAPYFKEQILHIVKRYHT